MKKYKNIFGSVNYITDRWSVVGENWSVVGGKWSVVGGMVGSRWIYTTPNSTDKIRAPKFEKGQNKHNEKTTGYFHKKNKFENRKINVGEKVLLKREKKGDDSKFYNTRYTQLLDVFFNTILSVM